MVRKYDLFDDTMLFLAQTSRDMCNLASIGYVFMLVGKRIPSPCAYIACDLCSSAGALAGWK